MPGGSDRARRRRRLGLSRADDAHASRPDGIPREIPVALTIAGSDSSAGAGAQADLKTFSALGVYGLTAITCVVAETPGKVLRIEPVSAELVVEQLSLLLEKFPVAAIKTGLLYSGEIVEPVPLRFCAMEREHSRQIPLVIDPVMVATSGDLLLRKEAVAIYENELFPLAAVLTPNLDEASALLGERITDLAGMRRAGRNLSERYGVPILLKGGHLTGEQAIDLLCVRDEVHGVLRALSRAACRRTGRAALIPPRLPPVWLAARRSRKRLDARRITLPPRSRSILPGRMRPASRCTR